MVAHSPMHLPPAQAPELTRFAPSAQQADQLLADLSNPAQSLLSVARAHNTTAESLSLWLSRPEIAERISAMRSAAALRTRWLAAEHLPACAELASRIVRASLKSPDLSTPDSALRAARLLLRLATFDPDARPRSTQTPKPRHTPKSDSPQCGSPVSSAPFIASARSVVKVHDIPSDSTAPTASRARPDPADTPLVSQRFEPASVSPPPSDSPSDSLNLPPGLLSSILPSFNQSERNPFLPESGLLKTAPNQRAVIKLRLKMQRKQILADAVKYLLQHNLGTEPQIPAIHREIEAFYAQRRSACSAFSPTTRSPPSSSPGSLALSA